jgi:glycosyltransferase involved in cell wall biosynthesis
MAVGVPVVASAVGGIPEAVTDGETGLLFQRGRAGELADKIELLLTDRQLRQRLCEKARQSLHRRFDLPAMAQALDAVYNSVIQE